MWRAIRIVGTRVAIAATACGATSFAVPTLFCDSKADVKDTTAITPSGKKYRVGILGATGAVGQRFVQLLEDHPWFDVTAVAASQRSAGNAYGKATQWQVTPDTPAYVKDLKVVSCDPREMSDVDFVFSALDASVAGEVEMAFAKEGIPVFSNAKNYRMNPDVPLIVPPVNSQHLSLVTQQETYKKNGGFIVTNANCSTTGMVIALKPLLDKFGIKAVHATTLQAISGAGYPGLPSLDILDNVVPYISGEEEKLETEYKKILGSYKLGESSITLEEFPLSAMVNRVHVRDGHSIALSVKLSTAATPEQVAEALRQFVPADKDILRVPSAPKVFIKVREECNRPQPRMDREEGNGYTTVVGRVRKDPVYDVKLFVLSHNTVMGAAGSSILNAELAAAKGVLKHRSTA